MQRERESHGKILEGVLKRGGRSDKYIKALLFTCMVSLFSLKVLILSNPRFIKMQEEGDSRCGVSKRGKTHILKASRVVSGDYRHIS